MRITRVAFSFFVVGFLAGTFEQAAGLNHGAAPPRRAVAYVTVASLAETEKPDAVPASLPAPVPAAAAVRGEPVPLASVEPEQLAALLQAPVPVPRPAQRPLDAGESGLAADRPMSLPDAAIRSPLPRPTFVSLPPPEAPAGLVVPEPRLAHRPPPLAVPVPVEVHEFIMPIERGRVTSMFNQGRYHPAIDLAAPLGTPVHATTRKQKVTFAGRRGGYGNLVITRDPSGRQHYYGHLQRIVAGIGSLLEQGDLLGLLGSTGHSTGPHVHYEVRTRSGGHYNPAALLFPGRRVRAGYAWNDARSPATTAGSPAPSTEAAEAMAGIGRAALGRGARFTARRAVRYDGRTRRRYSGRAVYRYTAGVVPRYVTRRASARHGARVAVRGGQPRPR